MLHSLELVGTFAFALSGALVGARKRMDIFGIVVLAVVAGLGGGIARDLLAGDVPVILYSDIYATPAAIAALIVALWSRSAPVEIGAAMLATVIRLIALRYRWSAPRPRI